MARRSTLLLAALIAVVAVVGPLGTAQAVDPAPGTILSAQRLIRVDPKTGADVLLAHFSVQGWPGDGADGLLQVGWVGSSFFPHSKPVASPCSGSGPCVWDVSLDFDQRFGQYGRQQARLTVHDAAGHQERIELGDVVVQRLSPVEVSATGVAAPLEVAAARRVATCARVRTQARGLRAGAIRLASEAGCQPRRPRQGRARILLSAPAVEVPQAYALLSAPTKVRLRHVRSRGQIRVWSRVTGLDAAWRRCIAPTDRRSVVVTCGSSAADGQRSFGTVQLRIGVARGARIDVTRVIRGSRYAAWVS